MKRIKTETRPNWQKKTEEIGFLFHSLESKYWDETAYYQINYQQTNVLETATDTLYDLCLQAVEYVINAKEYDKFKIPERFIPLIERSWNEDEPSIYGRFDLQYDGINPPKLLEFNADTPTSLYEAAIVQWYWAQDFAPAADQFNSIHEKLINYWKLIIPYLKPGKMYFSCINHSIEDLTTVEYLRDCAIQAGLDTEFIFTEDIGWDNEKKIFVDLDCNSIKNIFKLYPWEWLINEEFGQNLLSDENKTFWIEPAWKMILSNKAILPILWQLFPNHENLLPAYFNDSLLKNEPCVIKPLLSREGANVLIKDENNNTIDATGGEYGEEGFIYQKYCPLPNFENNFPVIGSWIIGGESAGIGIRESDKLITDNLSRFVPHLIKE